MKKNTFGFILKERIKYMGYTQEQFADAIGITRGTLVKHLSAKYSRYPKVEDILKMCELLDCDSDYLLGLQPDPRKETTDISQATGLTPAAIAALKARKRDQDDDYSNDMPGTLELKALNCILEHGLDEDGYMKSTIFTHIGYMLFSHFIDAKKPDSKRISIQGSNSFLISSSNKNQIDLYDENSGSTISFNIADLNLSQMENVRKSIYLLMDELNKKDLKKKQ